MNENITIISNSYVQRSALALGSIFENKFVKILLKSIYILGIVSVILLPINYQREFTESQGIFIIIFALALVSLAIEKFYLQKVRSLTLQTPKEAKIDLSSNKKINVFKSFSLPLAAALDGLFYAGDLSKISAKDLALNFIKSRDLVFTLNRIGLNRANLVEAIEKSELTGDVKQYVMQALEIAYNFSSPGIKASHFFLSFCQNSEVFREFLVQLKIDIKDVENIIRWETRLDEKINRYSGFFNIHKLKLTGGFGKDWIYGYTTYLKYFSSDLTRQLEKFGDGLNVIGREGEIKEIERALINNTKSNVVIVGDPGVGKKTVLLGFVKKVCQGEVSQALAHKHVFEIDLDSLMSGASSDGELTKRVTQILREAARAGNAIIFIENIANILSSDNVGQVDLSNVIIPILDSSGIHLIGACDIQSYNDLILSNSSLAQRFTRVSVDEPSSEQTIEILENIIFTLESQNDCLIPYETIKEAHKSAKKYMLNEPDPERSISLLSGTVTKAVSDRGQTIILPRDIENYITEKYNIPGSSLASTEKDVLIKLDQELHNMVIGQEEAIKAVSGALKRARAKVTNTTKPIGSFLFLGPTGVGKTATAKALAKVYYGGEDRMVRFDMSEYQNKQDIYRLIGDRENQGNLTTAVREKPFSLILFDEIEKADPDILNLFLQILDEGILTDGNGKRVSFANNIIIATSNAGADLIRESVNNGDDYEKVKKTLFDTIITKNIFKPELLNRFTQVVAFSPLSLEQIEAVAKLKIKHIQKTVLENQGIKLEIDPEAISELAKAGFDPQMGARPMERVLQEKIENMIADKILKGELNSGDSLNIGKIDLV